MRFLRTLILALAFVAVGAVATPETAEAKIVVVNWGDDIFPAGPLPAPWDAEPVLEGWQAGYKCDVIGIFWAYLFTWGCEPVAFRGDTYDDSPELVQSIAAVYTEGDKQMGTWGKHGRWLLAGLLVVGGMAGRNDD